MARVYLETSFISACVTTRSDAASVYRRESSLEWWHEQRHRHELLISTEVIGELESPGYAQSAAALGLVSAVPVLPIDSETLGFAGMLVREKVMPQPMGGDAFHVAAACVNALDFMLSWNVKHLANQNKLRHLEVVCRRAGLFAPRIVTPDLLWE